MESLKIHTVSSIGIQYSFITTLFYHPDSWNDWLYQWIGYDNWNYSRIFTVNPDQISGKMVWLKCDGLDTVATVRYNIQSHYLLIPSLADPQKCGVAFHVCVCEKFL